MDKLILAPVDLSKLSDAVKSDLVKEDVYNAKILLMLLLMLK